MAAASAEEDHPVAGTPRDDPADAAGDDAADVAAAGDTTVDDAVAGDAAADDVAAGPTADVTEASDAADKAVDGAEVGEPMAGEEAADSTVARDAAKEDAEEVAESSAGGNAADGDECVTQEAAGSNAAIDAAGDDGAAAEEQSISHLARQAAEDDVSEEAAVAENATVEASHLDASNLLDVDRATFDANKYVVSHAIVRSIVAKLFAGPTSPGVRFEEAEREGHARQAELASLLQSVVAKDMLDADPATVRKSNRLVAKTILRSILVKQFGYGEPAAEEEKKEAEEEVEEVPKAPAAPPMESIPWLELKKGLLECNPSAIDVFSDEPGFVNPVMVTGKLRTGKSYLMNALSDSQAFGVSSQARSFTQGVHICNRLVPCAFFGGPEDGPKLAFADSEGQADKGKSYDIKLATPLLLVSKVIIMNEICPIGPSKEDILHTIEIFIRAAEQVSERKKRKSLFGNLHIIMRDCSQPEQECWDIVFETEDPNISETDEQARAIEDRNRIRESVFVAFESVPKVWCLPKMQQSQAPKYWRDCHSGYVDKILEMRAFMASQLSAPKMLDDKPLTGTMIAALMPQLQEALKSDSPILNPPSMMQAVCDLEADRILQKTGQECEKFFRVDFAKRLPLAPPYFGGEVDCAKVLMTNVLRERVDHLPPASQIKAFGPFEERLALIEDRLAALNREQLAEKATQEAIDRANSLQAEMEMERRRADQARSEIDNLLAAREAEKTRADGLMKLIEQSNMERQGERDRIAELEELLNKEASEREADLQRQVAEEQKKVEEAQAAADEQLALQNEAAEEQEKLLEEQREQMEDLQRQMEEERKAREDAERDLGLREEEQEAEDEAASLMERAAEAKKEIPIILAVKEGDVSAVRGIVRHHPDALFQKDKSQRTALHFAQDPDITSAMLKAKGDPNAQDMGLWTPLHNAANGGFFSVAKLLVQHSANVLLTTRHNNTALDLAYDKPDMTVMLLGQLPELYNTLEPEVLTDDTRAAGPSAPAAKGGSSPSDDGDDAEDASDDEAEPNDVPPREGERDAADASAKVAEVEGARAEGEWAIPSSSSNSPDEAPPSADKALPSAAGPEAEDDESLSEATLEVESDGKEDTDAEEAAAPP